LEKRVGELYALLTSLGYFSNHASLAQSLKDNSHLLKHLFFTFLISINKESEYYQLLKETDLTFTDNLETGDMDKFMIVSGNLLTWKHSIVDLSQDDSFNLRYIANALFIYFQNIQGLGQVFSGYERKELKDGTFQMVSR
jgi:hypothetical protein